MSTHKIVIIQKIKKPKEYYDKKQRKRANVCMHCYQDLCEDKKDKIRAY